MRAPTEKDKNKLNTNNVLNAQDHNSTRSNQGQLKKPDTEESKQKSKNKLVEKGRNPQTGKQINLKSTKDS